MSGLRGKTSTKALYGNILEVSYRVINHNYNKNTSNVYFEAKIIAGEGGLYSTFPFDYDIYRQKNSNKEYELLYGVRGEASPVKVLINEGEEYVLMAETLEVEHYGTYKDEGIIFEYKLTSMKAANNSTGVKATLSGTIPRVTSTVDLHSVSNFNDEENDLTVEYVVNSAANYKKVQMALSVALNPTPVTNYRDIPLDDSIYTFNFTETEINRLCEITPSASRDLYVTVRYITQDNKTQDIFFAENLCKTTFSVKTEAPVIHSLEIEDINPITLALTGNKNIYVDNYSEVGYSINASASKGATIAKYEAQLWNDETSDDNIYGIHWTDLNGATGSFIYNPIPIKEYNKAINFRVIDSRNNDSSEKLMPIEKVEYKKLTCDTFDIHISMSKSDTTKGITTIYIAGQFWRGSFGAKDNTLKLELRYAENGVYNEWSDITVLVDASGGRWSAVYQGEGFSHNKIYTFQARVSDELEVIETEEKTVRITPVFDWGENDFRFNVPVNADEIEARIMKPQILDTETVLINDYGIGDFVWQTGEVAMGTNGTWHWVKWYSGKAECWGKCNYGTMSARIGWGSFYRSDVFNQGLPTDLFIDTPEVININMVNASMGGWICRHEKVAPAADNTGSFIYVCPEATTISSPTDIGFHVIGRWK
jgi:hypothetical protein